MKLSQFNLTVAFGLAVMLVSGNAASAGSISHQACLSTMGSTSPFTDLSVAKVNVGSPGWSWSKNCLVYNGSFSSGNAASLAFSGGAPVNSFILSTGVNGTGAIIATWDGLCGNNAQSWETILADIKEKTAGGEGTYYLTASKRLICNDGPVEMIAAIVSEEPVGGPALASVPTPSAVWAGLSLLAGLGVRAWSRRP